MSSFSSNLKDLRKNKGMSQIELAKALGISTSSVAMYEVGKREPNFILLKKIASYFKVDVNYLLGMDHVEVPGVYTVAGSQSGENNLKPEDTRISTKDAIELIKKFLFQNPEYNTLFHELTTIKKEDIFFFQRLIEKLK